MTPFDNLRKQGKNRTFGGTLLAFDPGETTGVALFDCTNGPTRITGLQIKTWPIRSAVEQFTYTLNQYNPDAVVMESYQVYSWKTDQHTFSDVPTLQIIGCLKTLCIQHSLPFYEQSAQIAKGFVDDDKLIAWQMYNKGERHSRDAMRHGCYFLIFGPKKDS